MASYLINHIPGIIGKRYLELGVHHGATFKAVQSTRKTGVDTSHPATFNMTTDQFFQQLDPSAKWDVVYIDACHEYHQVVRDYNNAIKHLADDGLIFLHDLVPPNEEHTAQHYCGDAYRLLYQWLIHPQTAPKFYTLNEDYGLTLVTDRAYPVIPSEQPVSYAQFAELTQFHRRYSVEEMQAKIVRLYR